MRPLLIFSVILIVACTTETFAQGFEKTKYQADSSRTLQYALLKPQKVEAGKKYPLVLALHGAGGRGNKNWERNCVCGNGNVSCTLKTKDVGCGFENGNT